MKVICDTHIWYYIGNKTIDTDLIDNNVELIANYNNIDELSRTFKLIVDSDYVRNAIKSIFKYKHDVIFEPPLIHLKKLSEPDYSYNIREKHSQILDFTQLIANGHELDVSKKEDFKKHCQDRQDGLQTASDMWNAEVEKIRGNIKDKKQHRKEDATPINRILISQMVASQTGTNGLPDNFDWNQIEFFEQTLKAFFTELELSKMKIHPNDWFDLLQFIYVQPGDKMWIRENRWLILIEKAGMSKYLYEIEEKLKTENKT